MMWFPYSWMVGAAKNMISIISNCFVNWKTVLTSGGAEIGQVVIRRGIFQGDSLSPLLFIVVMLPLTQVLRKIKDKSWVQSGEGHEIQRPSIVHG